MFLATLAFFFDVCHSSINIISSFLAPLLYYGLTPKHSAWTHPFSIYTHSLGDLIQSHGFKNHPHADNCQMYISSFTTPLNSRCIYPTAYVVLLLDV